MIMFTLSFTYDTDIFILFCFVFLFGGCFETVSHGVIWNPYSIKYSIMLDRHKRSKVGVWVDSVGMGISKIRNDLIRRI